MKQLILVFIFTLTLCATALAQNSTNDFFNDNFVITTYYPAPYGVYRNMRLHPSDLPTNGVDRGVMYFNQTNDQLYVYQNETTKWQPLGGGGGGYWTQQSGTANIYTTDSSGNVGIGTVAPRAKLELQDGAMLLSGTVGSTPVSGTGTRLMWIPAKGAFRAGYGYGNRWDDANIGILSTALGGSNIAYGNYSMAIGQGANATGDFSLAAGAGTTASGQGSMAMGWIATATGQTSTAIGYQTSATGQGSTALGMNTGASGIASTALGMNTGASGYASTATGYQTTASGIYSTAMGYGTIASGTWSTAMGQGTTASRDYSTAMGTGSIASGFASTAMGVTTNAVGTASLAMGNGARAGACSSTALGNWNVGSGDPSTWVATDPLFEIGIGTSDAARVNAVTVLKNGQVGIDTALAGYPAAYKLVVGGYTYVNGNLYAGGTYLLDSTKCCSDIRLKKNLGKITGVLAKLKNIDGMRFNWRVDEFKDRGFTRDRQIGIIAQDMEKEFPELVGTDDKGYKAISYDKFSAVLLEAIKEQQLEIEILKTEIDKLKAKK